MFIFSDVSFYILFYILEVTMDFNIHSQDNDSREVVNFTRELKEISKNSFQEYLQQLYERWQNGKLDIIQENYFERNIM